MASYLVTTDRKSGAVLSRRKMATDRYQMSDALDRMRGDRNAVPRNRTPMTTAGGESWSQPGWLKG